MASSLTNNTAPPASGYIRLATSSPASGATTAETLKNLRAIAQRAATTHHADILLLPEAYIGGYPRGSDFKCVVGARLPEGREEFLQYFEQAVDLGDVVGEGAGGGEDWVARRLPGDAVVGLERDGGGNGSSNKRGDGTRETLEEIAAQTGVFLVSGLIEKAGGSLYCAVVYVCPKRGMIGKRRKVLPVSSYLSFISLILIYISRGKERKGGKETNQKTKPTDRLRTPHLGPRLPTHPPSRKHHHPRRAHQPRRRHLLGELHAPPAPDAIRAKHQPVPGPDSRWAGFVVGPDPHHW